MTDAVDPYSTVNVIRTVLLSLIVVLLTLIYSHAIWLKPSRFVSDLAFAEPGADAQEVWDSTPAAAKGTSIQTGGWVICLMIFIGGMMIFEPGCQKALCKCFALIMVFWQLVWYGAMHGRIDRMDVYQRDFMAYFKKETIQEIVLFVIFGYLGFIAE
eukprot:TRINITY_DN46632_c0_g1_i1.p1 TRINITY_DN46632_c0_g1~~TRINITY_DN46632_c0_g1_i1.p1  ORF type:complete len:157 (-),score=16.10 TRINITY_DN46632_c0_g1_i1:38-508(-)